MVDYQYKSGRAKDLTPEYPCLTTGSITPSLISPHQRGDVKILSKFSQAKWSSSVVNFKILIRLQRANRRFVESPDIPSEEMPGVLGLSVHGQPKMEAALATVAGQSVGIALALAVGKSAWTEQHDPS